MITSLARTTILVRDYDEAIAFYGGKLGFEIIVDLQAQQGYRLVHLGLPSQPGVGIWLMQANGDEQQARVGRQTGGEPCLVLYTHDCRGTYAELKARGVSFQGEPAGDEWGWHVHFTDLYGNIVVLAELPGA